MKRGPSQFQLVLQVWGESYTRSLTDIALPALLAEGNIPALAASRPTRLKLFTTDADMRRISDAPSFKRLQAHVTVDYSSLDGVPAGDKYAAMTAIQRGIVTESVEHDAALVWILPDTIWSDGSLKTVARAADAGKRGVMHAGIRVSKSTALRAATDLIGGQSVVSVDPHTLVRVALDHMHPYYRAFFWDARPFNRNPVNIYWRVGDDGMLMRGFHLHPLMIYPAHRVETFSSTFDDDLPLLACDDPSDFYVVSDSDEAFEIDLAEDDWCAEFPSMPRHPSASYLAAWAFGSTNRHHRAFLNTRIRIHAVRLDERWDAAANESDRVVRRINRWLGMRYVAAAVLRVLGNVSASEIRKALPGGIGWHLCRPLPAWTGRWQQLAARLRLPAVGGAPAAFYKFAFRFTLAEIIGKNLTVRALGLQPAIGKPWRIRLRSVVIKRTRSVYNRTRKRIRTAAPRAYRMVEERLIRARKIALRAGRRLAKRQIPAKVARSISARTRATQRIAAHHAHEFRKNAHRVVERGRRKGRESYRVVRRRAKDHRPAILARRARRVLQKPVRIARRAYLMLLNFVGPSAR